MNIPKRNKIISQLKNRIKTINLFPVKKLSAIVANSTVGLLRKILSLVTCLSNKKTEITLINNMITTINKGIIVL